MVDESTRDVKPALGLAWSNMVHVRLMLHRNETVEGEEELRQVSIALRIFLKWVMYLFRLALVFMYILKMGLPL